MYRIVALRHRIHQRRPIVSRREYESVEAALAIIRKAIDASPPAEWPIYYLIVKRESTAFLEFRDKEMYRPFDEGSVYVLSLLYEADRRFLLTRAARLEAARQIKQ